MASRGDKATVIQLTNDGRLSRLCYDSKVKELKSFLDGIDSKTLAEMLVRPIKCVFLHTPLHDAAVRGQSKVLDCLLERAKKTNADINCSYNNGFTPLHLAASSGYEKCVKVLLEHGADISRVNGYGKTPKQVAYKSSIVRLLHSEGEHSCCP